ncbi:MAG: DUF58 domain-containing protein [Rhodoferax sp.]
MRRLYAPSFRLRPSTCAGDSAVRPTAQGLCWLAAAAALLVAAINDSHNGLFALCFVLLALWLQSFWQCRRQLRQAHWQAQLPEAVFAGEALRLQGSVQGAPGARFWLAGPPGAGAAACADGTGQAVCALDWPTQERGTLQAAPLYLVSDWPLGLWRCRRALPAMAALVYPRPAQDSPPPAHDPVAAHRQAAASELEDLRRYTPGDPPQRINWRAYARRDELLVSRFNGEQGGQALWLDFAQGSGDTEARLSQLAQWVLCAERDALEYGLRLPGLRVPPSRGRAHRHQCLRHLALAQPLSGGAA